MTTNKNLRRFTLAGLAPLMAAGAMAQEAPYPYVGLSMGQTHGKLAAEGITQSQSGPGLTITDIALDKRDTGYKLFGGYQLNRNVAIEAGYFHLGTLGFTSTTPGGTLTGQSNMQGLNLDLVGTLPLSQSFSVIGRIGGTYGRTRTTLAPTGALAVANPTPSERKGNYKAGIGLQYEVSRSVLLRGEVERYRMNDAVGGRTNVDVYSVGLVFPFGRAETPAPRAMAAPYVAPVAAAMPPPPAPVVAAAPPPVVVAVPAPPPAPVVPERRRVSFSAESLFDFDKAEVGPNGKAALDTFAKELEGTRYETITVEGHTDRIGSAAYNQTLSQQRADAVKGYLLTTGKIEAAKVESVGKSESDPVTKADQCVGNKASPKLISCLQPDRRVDIEVKGTR